MAREQAPSNLYLLPSTESLDCPMKPTSKDEECTH